MTREIPLTKGYVALVDDADFGWLSESKWFASEQKGGAYAMRWNGPLRRNEYMHRVILGDDIPFGDHANRNRLDNQRHNLRSCARWQNAANTKRPSATGFRGISRRPKGTTWTATIKCAGKVFRLGGHPTAEAAARAYDEAAIRLHGPFAVLNFHEERRSPVLAEQGPVSPDLFEDR